METGVRDEKTEYKMAREDRRLTFLTRHRSCSALKKVSNCTIPELICNALKYITNNDNENNL